MNDKILSTLQTDKELINILETLGTKNILQFDKDIGIINKKLFTLFCTKKYLTECEPEYCSARIAKQCKFINAFLYIKNHYKIDIINRRVLK